MTFLPYLYIMKTKIMMSLAYRFDVIANVLVQAVVLAAAVFFWEAVYADQSMVADTTLKQMIDYAIITLLLVTLYSTSVEDEINANIKQGNVALDFLKPASIMGMYFASDIGIVIGNLFMKMMPLLLFAWLFFGLPIPVSGGAFLLFLCSGCLGFLILWIINAMFGLFSFWVIELGPVGLIKRHIINLLSGMMIPLWFLPFGLEGWLKYLPFVHIYQTPISIYIGKMEMGEAYFSLIVQVVWLGILFACFCALQKRAYKNVIIQGG